MKITHRELKNSVDQIGNKTEGAGLRSVAENGERGSTERLPNKRRHDTSVSQAHPWAVSIKDADDLCIDVVKAVIGHCHRLGESLCLVVNTARPDRVHIAPVIFLLRMDERIAIAFGG